MIKTLIDFFKWLNGVDVKGSLFILKLLVVGIIFFCIIFGGRVFNLEGKLSSDYVTVEAFSEGKLTSDNQLKRLIEDQCKKQDEITKSISEMRGENSRLLSEMRTENNKAHEEIRGYLYTHILDSTNPPIIKKKKPSGGRDTFY